MSIKAVDKSCSAPPPTFSAEEEMKDEIMARLKSCEEESSSEIESALLVRFIMPSSRWGPFCGGGGGGG